MVDFNRLKISNEDGKSHWRHNNESSFIFMRSSQMIAFGNCRLPFGERKWKWNRKARVHAFNAHRRCGEMSRIASAWQKTMFFFFLLYFHFSWRCIIVLTMCSHWNALNLCDFWLRWEYERVVKCAVSCCVLIMWWDETFFTNPQKVNY